MPRSREPVIPPHVDLARPTGRYLLNNVYAGRNMAGVKPGEIKKLLVLESLPKPVNFTGGMDPLSYVGTFTLERVLGTVPVEADGSAYFEAPALRSLLFVALDENDLAVKRMQSFTTVAPGRDAGLRRLSRATVRRRRRRRHRRFRWPPGGRPAASSRSPARPTCPTSPATSSRSSTAIASSATTTTDATAA